MNPSLRDDTLSLTVTAHISAQMGSNKPITWLSAASSKQRRSTGKPWALHLVDFGQVFNESGRSKQSWHARPNSIPHR